MYGHPGEFIMRNIDSMVNPTPELDQSLFTENSSGQNTLGSETPRCNEFRGVETPGIFDTGESQLPLVFIAGPSLRSSDEVGGSDHDPSIVLSEKKANEYNL